MPIGQVTRGTTGTNRLRRVDRWIARHPALRRADDPIVVDLGFTGAAPGFQAEGLAWTEGGEPIAGIHPRNRAVRVFNRYCSSACGRDYIFDVL